MGQVLDMCASEVEAALSKAGFPVTQLSGHKLWSLQNDWVNAFGSAFFSGNGRNPRFSSDDDIELVADWNSSISGLAVSKADREEFGDSLVGQTAWITFGGASRSFSIVELPECFGQHIQRICREIASRNAIFTHLVLSAKDSTWTIYFRYPEFIAEPFHITRTGGTDDMVAK